MKLIDITVRYGDNCVLEKFNYTFSDKKINCVLGASGYGKTTILNVIANNVKYEGKVEGGGVCGYLFQEQRLVPALTVFQNLELVLTKQIPDKTERREKIEKILREVELFDRKDDYPIKLSGGMAQRVALARAFVYKSDVLLMDEPFNGLDVNLKKRLLEFFLSLYEKNPKTVVFVTHSIDECLLLADKLSILSRPPATVSYSREIEIPQKERSLTSDSLHKIRLDILNNY